MLSSLAGVPNSAVVNFPTVIYHFYLIKSMACAAGFWGNARPSGYFSIQGSRIQFCMLEEALRCSSVITIYADFCWLKSIHFECCSIFLFFLSDFFFFLNVLNLHLSSLCLSSSKLVFRTARAWYLRNEPKEASIPKRITQNSFAEFVAILGYSLLVACTSPELLVERSPSPLENAGAIHMLRAVFLFQVFN